jgi:hypothetical protein
VQGDGATAPLPAQAKLGQDPAGATLDAARPGTLYLARAYLRPLVKTHPVTGRRALHIGRHAFGIPGLGSAEGASFSSSSS